MERHPQTIRVIRQAANAGPAAARNAGLRAAAGTLVCFLDADDEYAAGFFRKAADLLADQPRVAAILTDVVLIDMHRDIHPIQLEDIRKSLPSNVILRRPVAEIIGGFPEHTIFRGESAGEDLAFKRALIDNFTVLQIDDQFLRHRVRRGGHLDRFLDATEIVGDQRIFVNVPPEQADGSLSAAIDNFSRSVAERIRQTDRTRIPAAFDADGAAGVEVYEPLRNKFDPLPGTMPPVTAYALYRLAAFGSGAGNIVVRARSPERVTAWLNAGTQSVARRPIVSYPAVTEPVRLLFIDLGLENWRAEFQLLASLVVRSGCVAFGGIRGEAEVEAIHTEMLKAHLLWDEIGRVGELRVYKKG